MSLVIGGEEKDGENKWAKANSCFHTTISGKLYWKACRDNRYVIKTDS